MPSTIIVNIKTLYGLPHKVSGFLKGKEMSNIHQKENCYVLIDKGKVLDIGNMSSDVPLAENTIDASDCLVMPIWCDSHTHIVYARSREEEYVQRLQGMSYEEIAALGGGILNSAKKLQNTSQEALYEGAVKRLHEVMKTGTGAIEIKSGYGLTLEDEMKMLRVIRRLKESHKIAIKSTFLGAHAIPTVYKDKRHKYIDLLIDQMLPLVADEGLADYCDVFCDKGFFTVEETDKILIAASKYGLKPKIHANELAISGGVQVGIKNNAISVDHLERIGDEEIEALKNSKTIPTVLPSCSFFLKIPYAPARKMIDAGLGIAIATDFNPGSSPSGNIPLLMAIACNNMQLLPSEVFNGLTINGACAMELEKTHGTIEIGKSANLILTKKIPSLEYMVYHFGTNHIDRVMVEGEWVS